MNLNDGRVIFIPDDAFDSVIQIVTAVLFCRRGWGKAPMWGKGPTTEITFMDGNRGNICTRVFSYVIGPPVAVDADGENTS